MTNVKEKKFKNLIEKINYHNDLYYNKDNPQISDVEYDALIAELKRVQKKYPNLVSADNPLNKIGGKVSAEFSKFNHPTR